MERMNQSTTRTLNSNESMASDMKTAVTDEPAPFAAIHKAGWSM